ncbi:hypothetical protein NBG4_500024 [Candidatus Sulfobium mesophilum]|uniref:Ice-binding protein C-terminal domain-containing protein n=1 Tax=Candidatus Sulfobium mesophilum TaxID=2016548 RepID=A0A2U3QJ03_9BACT|nr:hypothetical protein NBG4_500024 [Candidatus Sulfobium mesophilum]
MKDIINIFVNGHLSARSLFVQFILILGLVLVAAGGGYAAVTDINSAIVQSRVINDVPGATFTGVNNYPSSISLSETNVSASTGFGNRDQWLFSADGSTAYPFQHNDYFQASFDLVLTGNPITPRKEAGFLFHTASGNGDIQFIVNTDGHEVVQFGGISFYSFNTSNGITYNSGDTITLGMSYFLDGNNMNALQFSANGVNSPLFEFPGSGNGALDVGDGSTLGAYFQIVDDPTNPTNSGSAVFSNISITGPAPTPVPEPSTIVLLGVGLAGVGVVRRKLRK